MIVVAVEGDTDIPFVKALCQSAGFEPREPLLDARGKSGLDLKIKPWAKAAQGSPHLIVRDLDRDAPCAPEWLQVHAPPGAGEFFCLRLAVRAVESWALGDAAALARTLHIPTSRIPSDPDSLEDPKRALVDLARLSKRPELRRQLVPATGVSRKAGPGYEAWLIDFGTHHWNIERAQRSSESLRRAAIALKRLNALWQRL